MISCLTVTRNRPQQLDIVIDCFNNQTYTNKELIIIYEEDDIKTKDFVKNIKKENIKIFEISVTPKLSLGELRNISVNCSNGEYICQWDDDDWFHSSRLETQLKALKLSRKPACIMSNWLIYDKFYDRTYISNKRLWEGSILCETKLFKLRKYAKIKKGEDTFFINYIKKKNLYVLINTPQLYIYVIHGNNTWDRNHFINFLKSSKQLNINFTHNIINYKNNVQGSLLLNKLFRS